MSYLRPTSVVSIVGDNLCTTIPRNSSDNIWLMDEQQSLEELHNFKCRLFKMPYMYFSESIIPSREYKDMKDRLELTLQPPGVCFSFVFVSCTFKCFFSWKKLKKYGPDYQTEQHFFKYFLILPAVFEKIAAEIVVCSVNSWGRWVNFPFVLFRLKSVSQPSSRIMTSY